MFKISTSPALALCFAAGMSLASLGTAKGWSSPMAHAAPPVVAAPERMLVYVGTYTKGPGDGIFLYTLDMKSGELTPAGIGPKVESPSFLAIHPSRKYLYAVNEIGNYQGKDSGSVSAYSIEPKTGKLTLLNVQTSGGSAPCHISVDRAGKNALIANYSGGSVAVLPIKSDGSLAPASAFIQHKGTGPDASRQEGPHAHSINLDPSNKYAFAADLGLDKVLVYRFDAAKGTLTPSDPPAAIVAGGSGPRHFAFHPSGRFAYVINEMKSTITGFAYDGAGKLTELETVSSIPGGPVPGNSTAEVQVSPNGKFLYGSNRGHNSIVIYRIDPNSGRLTYVGNESTRGKVPRNFGIDPTGTFLIAANQESGNVEVFRMDPDTGKLTHTGHSAQLTTPVCVRMMPLP
jgi:6-phosphogluconolactonase